MKKQKTENKSGLIYSTDSQFNSKIENNREPATLAPAKQDLRLKYESHKGGKKAVVIYNFIGKTQDLEELGRTLKIKCSTGGSVKEGLIILNGDLRQKVADELTKLGYRYKLAGG